MTEYEPVIGLEVHAQLSTRTKMFCSCSAAYGGEPNTQVCPVCLGLPGALPVANEIAVESAVKMGIATHCQIATQSVFARKNYFYPDCPKNYQISQFDRPLCEHGHVTVGGGERRIGITRIHLEEDAGKLLHEEDNEHSYADMNRVGVPLIEIVSEPDIRTSEEASEYLQKLRALVRYLDICDGNMEEGSLRCDVNISLREKGATELGTKTEIKNMNSFKAVEQALHYEIERQSKMLRDGQRIEQQTLLWDAAKGESKLMRSKEQAHDYRYFPEPDLLILETAESMIDGLRGKLPELPEAKAQRFIDELGLPEYDAHVLTASKEISAYYEETAKSLGDAKAASNWVMGEVLRELKEKRIDISEFRIKPADLAALAGEVKSGKINMPTAKDIFREMLETGADSKSIIKSKGLEQISDEGALDAIVSGVIDANPNEVGKYLAGKEKLLQFLVGQVMKQSKGKANPKIAADLLKTHLAKKR